METKAKADPAFLLNKIPQPITGLGYAGNIALILRVANKMFVKNRWLGLLASGAAHAAMYQLGRRGTLAADTNIFSIAGDEGHYMGEDMGEDSAMGDLDGLAVEGDNLSGTEWDAHVAPGT